MAGGKESYHSLREFVRRAEYRRFRARHRDNRWADFLGFSPDGKHVVGFWDGEENPTMFSPADIQWTSLVAYL